MQQTQGTDEYEYNLKCAARWEKSAALLEYQILKLHELQEKGIQFHPTVLENLCTVANSYWAHAHHMRGERMVLLNGKGS